MTEEGRDVSNPTEDVVNTSKLKSHQSTIPCAFGRFLVTQSSIRRLRIERNVVKMARPHSDDEYEGKREDERRRMMRQSGAFIRERGGPYSLDPWMMKSSTLQSAAQRRHSLHYPTSMSMPPHFAYMTPFGMPFGFSNPHFSLPYGSTASQHPTPTAYAMMMSAAAAAAPSHILNASQAHRLSTGGLHPGNNAGGEGHGGGPINVVGGRAKAAAAAAAAAANTISSSASPWPAAPLYSAAPVQSMVQPQPHLHPQSSSSEAALPAVQQQHVQQQQQQQQIKKAFCGACGTEILRTFCSNCGLKRED